MVYTLITTFNLFLLFFGLKLILTNAYTTSSYTPLYGTRLTDIESRRQVSMMLNNVIQCHTDRYSYRATLAGYLDHIIVNYTQRHLHESQICW
jgi:hypothetical protein